MPEEAWQPTYYGTEILELPVAGIMSDLPVTEMASRYEKLSERVRSLKQADAPFMTPFFHMLPVIPKMK